jgi:gliding motility-associated-like protein
MKRVGFLAIFLLALYPMLHAQLCTGSLGDPILNMTFGVGSNGGPELTPGQTTYHYSTRGCPKENEYSLTNFVFGCFDNTWQPLLGDHTPNDQDGYYMLVNSSFVKGDLFVYNLKNLCPDTKYEFATWIKNVMRKTACDGISADPELNFSVETLSGIVLASYNTNAITKEEDATWRQFGLVFQVSAGQTEVVLRISNTANEACGNALALDDITVRPCGPEVRAIIASNNQSFAEVCSSGNTSFLLNTTYGAGYANPVFQWQIRNGLSWDNIPGATAKTYQRPQSTSGTYIYRVLIAETGQPFSPQCRIGSNELTINVLAVPFVQATGYIYGCLDGEVILLASGASKYLWTGPNGFTSTSQRPVLAKIQYSDSGVYTVTGTTAAGCVNSASALLKVYPKATASSGGGTSICEGASTVLSASGGTKYYWEPRATLSDENTASPTARPVESTRYYVRVSNDYGCSDTTSVQVNVWKNPKADAGTDMKTRLGLPQVLKGSAHGSDVTWFWTPQPEANTRHLLTPSVNPSQTTMYTLHVVSSHGCGTHTDNVLVKVFDKVLIPNAFSPNGDGINDTWYIEPLEFFFESVTEVYNRYGQLVYRSKGYATPWNGMSNGKLLPAGTYYYVLDIGVKNQPKLTGSLTIFR